MKSQDASYLALKASVEAKASTSCLLDWTGLAGLWLFQDSFVCAPCLHLSSRPSTQGLLLGVEEDAGPACNGETACDKHIHKLP